MNSILVTCLVSKLLSFKVFKFVQLLNIPPMFTTLVVLKIDISINTRDSQFINIESIYFTLTVSKFFENPIDCNDLHDENIFPILVTLEVVKLLRFKDFKEIQL